MVTGLLRDPLPPARPSRPEAEAPARATARRIRVLVADDAVVVRGLVSKWLEEAGFEVVATAANGRFAVEALARTRPDVVLLDIEMPELDGLGALPLMLARRPDLQVVMMSTLTQRNADISLRCLSLGAVDYLPKPDTNRHVTTSAAFRAELVEKVRALGGRGLRARASIPASIASIASTASAAAAAHPAPRPALPPPRRPGALPPRALLVGASTGGPRAIGEVLSGIGRDALARLPVLVVQHMPPVFTAVFAEHLAAQTGLRVREGEHGEPLLPGCVYVAPGGRHMGLQVAPPGGSPGGSPGGHPRDGRGVAIRLDDGPPENYCRPAVDVLFRDAAAILGGAALAVVLTGMGSDGTQGARALEATGAPVFAQDEATSTVWGMPGSIARAGLAREVLPLPGIGPALRALIAGGPFASGLVAGDGA